MTESELAEIERREQEATPGPWKHASGYVIPPFGHNYKVAQLAGTVKSPGLIARGDKYVAADSEFIAHAREDIPRLLAEVRRLREENEKLLDALGRP